MSSEIDDTIWKIIHYMEKDERKHYQQCDEEGRKNHIYVDVLRVKNWVLGVEPNPDVVLEVCPECWQLTLEIHGEGITSDNRHYPLEQCTNCDTCPDKDKCKAYSFDLDSFE